MKQSAAAIAGRLLAWHRDHGRHELPWQKPRTMYRTWVAEIMLQQTRAATVCNYFPRFVERFPSLDALAAAELDAVLGCWSGLGYYRRARNLHAAARQCIEQHDGQLPESIEQLQALPGIGRSTAGAILAQACGQRHPILDANARRVLARFHGIDAPAGTARERRLWQLAEQHTPSRRVADYTQAMMDLGATLCVRGQPDCGVCPLHDDCAARKQGSAARLPLAAVRRERPQRQVWMLLLRDRRGRVLLERRGPDGVWPGLWSLPEAASERQARAFAAGFGAGRRRGQQLDAVDHGFTHFALRILPLAWRQLSPAAQVADNDQHVWHAASDWPQLGLPAPVRRLLERTCPDCDWNDDEVKRA